MKHARWIDHLPPWLSFGAVATTGAFSPAEVTAMALPLLAAAGIEAQRLNMARYRRVLEVVALAALAAQVLLRIGLVPTTVITLFVLCGIRLTLPREAPQRRQLLLMSFLLFLVTAIATFEMDFLLWALAWAAASSLALLHHAWEASATLRKSHAQPPPYRYILPWTAVALMLAGLCFVALPRQALGLRFFPWSAGGISGSAAGLSDSVDLSSRGPISPNREVVLRIIPPEPLSREQRQRFEAALALLRGITLEGLEGQRWEALPDTPPPMRVTGSDIDWEHLPSVPGRLGAEFYVAPSPFGIIPLPLGRVTTIAPQGMPIRAGVGGSTRWFFPSRRPIPLKVLVDPGADPDLGTLGPARFAQLTALGEGTGAALTWSRRIAPGPLSASLLTQRLSRELRTYAYTTTNPSGQAPDPLQDFLERSHAGHCEYFASALALALRHRGVAARVVNGYRLGPWIEEGSYWLVTQDQAHSWVEFFDPETHTWRLEDPTPSAPEGLASNTLWAAVQRWTDALRFRWDRNVVRFSNQDQQDGLAWLQAKASALPRWRPDRATVAALGGSLLLLLALRFLVPWWLRRRTGLDTRSGPQGITALKPLLRKTRRRYPPESGETARTWLLRLAAARPELQARLWELAEETDAVAYGGHGDARLKQLIRPIARLLGQQKR